MHHSLSRTLPFVALAFLAGSCGPAERRVDNGHPRGTPVPSWVRDRIPPQGCRIGDNGPTIRLWDAPVWAEENARCQMAFDLFSGRVRNLALATATSVEEVLIQEVDNILANVVTVGTWIDFRGEAGPKGSAWALACRRDRLPAGLRPAKGVPDWVAATPRNGHCAVASWGPTVRAVEQDDLLEEAARERLAATLALRNSAKIVDGIPGLECATEESVPQEALRQAQAGKIVQRWRDTDGRGPLGIAGTAYAMICL